MSVSPATPTTSRFRLQVWRVVTCLLWLLAAFGILQYSVHGWHVAQALQSSDAADAHGALIRILVWDVAYLAAACITLATATAALLYRGWARVVLRVLAALLALWFLVTAILLGAHLQSFVHNSQMLLAQQPHLAEAARELAARVQHRYEVTIALKAAAVLILAWLAWRLGVTSVRAQFPEWSWRKKTSP